MTEEFNLEDPFNLNSYFYQLPPELIAQVPAEPREGSRLLVLDRRSGTSVDRYFRDIIDYIQPGDTLVINRSRVMPARLMAWKHSGAKVEILLLARRDQFWEALVKPARRVKKGSVLFFPDYPEVEIRVRAELDIAGGRLLELTNCPDQDSFIEQVGMMPLPPYINRAADDRDDERYQTVYARETGSAAAPTAGLHFSQQLLQEIAAKGANIAEITLHVGLGTFRPVNCQDIRCHHMHSEFYEVDKTTAELLNATRRQDRRIIAVGTTVVRTLETVCDAEGIFVPRTGETDCFILPGYRFKAIDMLITNFHLPGSSLLMLVAAWAGLENTRSAYQNAIAQGYRFFSYGDAMLIV